MRNVALLAPALLAACSAAPAEPPAIPTHGTVPGHICNAEGADRFIGQPGTSETGAEIMRATNSAILRWAPPGVMLTMDFSASRVTVRLDPANKVTAINCG
jgi:hypothetical protein